VGCGGDEDTPEKVYSPAELFPLTKGQYQVYDVVDVQFSEIADPDTSRYELLTDVVDSFPNNADAYTYVIHRSKRDNENDEWEFIDTWSVRTDDNEAIVYEGNTPYLKIGSSREGSTWNGNAYNNLGEDDYEVVSSPASIEINGISFDDPIVIEQEMNDDPIVFTDLRTEIYASGVGLIYKETTQLYYCVESSCNNQNIIIDGVYLKQSIKSYGVH
jgi:hypothetical protein